MRLASVWNTNASISMPVPAIAHAINAPATPVCWANRAGNEKTPAPTIDPTTIPVIVQSVTLRVGFSTSVAIGASRSVGWPRATNSVRSDLVARYRELIIWVGHFFGPEQDSQCCLIFTAHTDYVRVLRPFPRQTARCAGSRPDGLGGCPAKPNHRDRQIQTKQRGMLNRERCGISPRDRPGDRPVHWRRRCVGTTRRWVPIHPSGWWPPWLGRTTALTPRPG